MDVIFLSTQSSRKEVQKFLTELKQFLNQPDFDTEKNLVIIKKKKKAEDEKFSTPYTLLDLEYEAEDVVKRLKELCVQEYSETKIDKDDINPPLLFVFGKDIEEKLIYIKLKVKNKTQKHVLCVSFHYAKEKMIFPYAQP